MTEQTATVHGSKKTPERMEELIKQIVALRQRVEAQELRLEAQVRRLDAQAVRIDSLITDRVERSMQRCEVKVGTVVELVRGLPDAIVRKLGFQPPSHSPS